MKLIDIVQVPYLMRPGLIKLELEEVELHRETTVGIAEKSKHWLNPTIAHAVSGFVDWPVKQKLVELAPFLESHKTIHELMFALQEDFAVMNSDGMMELLCFSTPSGWAPEKYIGKSFNFIHEHIPDADLIRKGADHFVKLLTGDQAWRRYVWSLVPNPERCRHPDVAHDRTWDTTDTIYFRWEVQTVVPLEPGKRMLFLVNHQVVPLFEACKIYDDVIKVNAALESMTPAIREYKNLAHPRVAELVNNLLTYRFQNGPYAHAS